MSQRRDRYLDVVVRRFSKMSFESKLFTAYLFLLLILFLFFPFVKFSPTTSDVASRSVGLLSGIFFKTGFVVILSFCVLIGWNMNPRFKELIHSTFGFKDNDNLFNFGLLWVILTALLSMSESIKASRLATATMKVTFWQWLATFLIFVWLIYSLIVMLKEAKLIHKTWFLRMMKREDHKHSVGLSASSTSVQSLFDEDDQDSDEKGGVHEDDESDNQ